MDLQALRRRVDLAPDDAAGCTALARVLARAGDPLAAAYEAGLRCGPSRFMQLAAADHPALIVGGDAGRRERVARTLHALGPRCGGPWVVVRASAVPALQLHLEAELFGYEKGSITLPEGRVQPGPLERPGTLLFLDDIERCSREVQRKIVRVVRDRVVRRLGSNDDRLTDARFVAGTATALASPPFDATLGAMLLEHVLAVAAD